MSDHVEIFNHHIYEYTKGLRRLVLYTGHSSNRAVIEQKLRRRDIDYLILDVTDQKVNCFFGDKACIDVIRTFSDRPLHELTLEEDFILGAMLGYDIKHQCNRYLQRSLALKSVKKVA
jgi:hypothetical protein